mgnify:CR=1 FL=1
MGGFRAHAIWIMTEVAGMELHGRPPASGDPEDKLVHLNFHLEWCLLKFDLLAMETNKFPTFCNFHLVDKMWLAPLARGVLVESVVVV